MSEGAVEPPIEPEPSEAAQPITPPDGMTENLGEFYDEARLLYFWRNPDDGLIYSRPYDAVEVAGVQKRLALDGLRAQAEEAIPYLDERIKLSLAYFADPAPAAEATAAQIKVLCDLAAYSAGTLKRMIVVLGELTGRPV